jgi:hypothetical protein
LYYRSKGEIMSNSEVKKEVSGKTSSRTEANKFGPAPSRGKTNYVSFEVATKHKSTLGSQQATSKKTKKD